MLIASFGVGMGLFGIALALATTRYRPAWWLLWYLPVFLATHVALLGTWLHDGALLVLAIGGLVALGRPTAEVVHHEEITARVG